MKFSFMTFSCPTLSLADVLSMAAKLGYDGVEPRISAGHAHGIELTMDAASRRGARLQASRSRVALSCLATSCCYASPGDNARNVQDTLKAVDLAADVGAQAIRVFGGDLPDGLSREDAIDLLAGSMEKIAPHAARRGVTVCLETHDSWTNPQHLAAVMRKVNHPHIGVNWDIMHPVRQSGWTIEDTYKALKPWIRHVHVHDGCDEGGNLCFKPIGQGTIDHGTALKLLKADGYQGFISGEWIGWEPSETHLPRELATLKRLESEV